MPDKKKAQKLKEGKKAVNDKLSGISKEEKEVKAEEAVLEEKKESALKSKAKEDKKEKEKKPKKEGKKTAGPQKAKNPNKLKKSEKKHSKKYREVVTLIEKNKVYDLEEAIDLAKKTSTTKFDSSVEVHVKLGVDTKKADQQIRGSVVLPHGTGKSKIVAAVVAPTKEKEAKTAGADFVGSTDLIEKIGKGWLEFDVLVATPDLMGELGKVAKVLGPKGLMPNPKVGTVTQEPEKTIKNLKQGMVEYRTDSYGIVHQVIGKVSFEDAKLKENHEVFLEAIKKAKPASAKGIYLKAIYIATTMGPSVRVGV